MVKFGKPAIDQEELQAVTDVLDSGVFVHGNQTSDFEREFAEKFGYQHAVSVSSCTAGLHLAHWSLLQAAEPIVGRGRSEVICTAMTHVATAHAIELAGLKPIFVDCDAHDGNINAQAIEAALSERTAGIAAMHFNGIPCDMPTINEFADRYGLYVVEDCAISLGATLGGQPVGSLGDIGCFSFHPVKQMTTGEGGMIVTNHASLADQLRLQRAFGVDRNFKERRVPGFYDVPLLGFNYRMPELAAAIGRVQLKKFDQMEATRCRNFNALAEHITDIKGLEIKGHQGKAGRAYYTLICEVKQSANISRDQVIEKLLDRGVQPSIYYPHPIPRLSYYKRKYKLKVSSFPNAKNFADNCLALPIGAHLGLGEMSQIGDALSEIMK